MRGGVGGAPDRVPTRLWMQHMRTCETRSTSPWILAAEAWEGDDSKLSWKMRAELQDIAAYSCDYPRRCLYGAYISSQARADGLQAL